MLGLVLLICTLFSPGCIGNYNSADAALGQNTFVTRVEDQLMLNGSPFRFVSANVPTLTMVEDISWHIPTKWEQEDAIKTIVQMGGKVIRTYVFSVAGSDDYPGQKRHVYGPYTGEDPVSASYTSYTFEDRKYKFDEDMFKALDQAIALCDTYGIKLILPFVDMYQWWGGINDYAAFEGKAGTSFWTDSAIKQDFKATICYVLNRTNTITGKQYKDEPSIMAWETGNEATPPSHSWTGEIASFIKGIDSNHLVVDGKYGIDPESLTDNNIDIVSNHYYPNHYSNFAEQCGIDSALAAGKKPFIIGEYSFNTPENIRDMLDVVIQNGVSGALIWSLRYHNKDGGFYPHTEGTYNGTFYQAYRWPGFPSGDSFNETETLNLIREYAYKIDGIATVPTIPALDTAPVLLPIDSVSEVSWQGVTGAVYYSIERSLDSIDWGIVNERYYDEDVYQSQAFDDTTAITDVSYYYRIKAHNSVGSSEYSNVVGPVVAKHEINDTLRNNVKIYARSSDLEQYGSNPPAYGNDPNVYKSKAEDQYITYALPTPTTMSAITIVGYTPQAEEEDFVISASIDDVEYTVITPSAITIDRTSANGDAIYNKMVYSAAIDNFRYIKIDYPSIDSAVGNVKIEYSTDGSPLTFPPQKTKTWMSDGILHDDLNNADKMYEKSSNLGFETGDTYGFYKGDVNRLTRNANNEEYIVYKAAGDMNSFKVVQFSRNEGANKTADFGFYTSTDGTNFTVCTNIAKNEKPGDGWWSKIDYAGYTLPDDTRYLKIVFPLTTNEQSWNPQLASADIAIGSSVFEAPAGSNKTDIIDNFESYSGLNSKLNEPLTINPWGSNVTFSLNANNKIDGSYGLNMVADLDEKGPNDGSGFAGMDKAINNADWLGNTGIEFWVDPNGSSNLNISIQFSENSDTDSEPWKADYKITVDQPQIVRIPFSAFSIPSWWLQQNVGRGNGKVDPGKIASFGLYIDGSGQHNLFFDSFKLYKLPEIDKFEEYGGDNTKLNAAYTMDQWGSQNIELSLDSGNKNDGENSLKMSYDFSDKNYGGVKKQLNNADWSGKNGIQLWVKPDGNNRGMTVQFKETSGEYWKASFSLKGTEPYLINVPFSAFASPDESWNPRDNVIDKSSIEEFSMYIDMGQQQEVKAGELYFDSIEVVALPEIDSFEYYQGSNSNLQSAYVMNDWGDDVTLTLDNSDKKQGEYNLKFEYALTDEKGFAGVEKQIRGMSWKGGNAISFWVKPDGNNRGITIQFKEQAGETWKAPVLLSGNEWTKVEIPLAAFVSPTDAWNAPRDNIMDLTSVDAFAIYADKGTGAAGSGSIYFDDIKIANIDTIDDFDYYSGSELVASGAYTPNEFGNVITLTPTAEYRDSGKYGVAINYTEDSNISFTGVTKKLNNVNWVGYNGITLWLKPDGTGNKFVIQFKEADGEAWEAYYKLSGTDSVNLQIPFASFMHPGWYAGGNGKMDLQDITEFSIYINQDAGEDGANTIYLDSIKLSTFNSIDDFEFYYDSLRISANYISNQYGDPITVTLDSENKKAGTYGMRLDYDLTNNGWGGVQMQTNGSNWNDQDGIQLWVKPSDTNHGVKVQFKETNGDTWEANLPALSGTDWINVKVPFSEFAIPVDGEGNPQSWAYKNGVLDLNAIEHFAIYLNPGEGTQGPGSFVFDSIELYTQTSNQAPVFEQSIYTVTTNENTAVSGIVSATDADVDTLTYALTTQGAHGTTSVNADGGWTYIPAPSYTGTDSFTVTVSDGKGGTATVTVNITISAVVSGGSNANTTVVETPVNLVIKTDANQTTAATTTVAKLDASGKAIATVTDSQIADAVKKVLDEATKQNAGMTTVVEIKVDAPANSKAVETSIPKSAVNAVANSKIDALTVSSPIADITFSSKAFSTISKEAVSDVKLAVTKMDSSALLDQVKQTVGDRPVFNFNVTSGDKTISQFGGSVRVAVPYTPKAGEDTEAIVIYYINAEGKAEIVKNCVYNQKTGTISFETNHFSTYAVGYNKVSFKDVDPDIWYGNAVDFIAAREITTGTGNNNFSPNAKLTRGQFIVQVMKAYGISPDNNLEDNFADAGDTYYTGYLAAAKRLGISEGIGNNMFAPNNEITRQEMFTLLYNLLKTIGKLLEVETVKDIATYKDVSSIATWAKDAMTVLVGAGIVSGDTEMLSPTSTTNRAQLAQVLYNLLSK